MTVTRRETRDDIEREHERRNVEQLQWLRARLKQLHDDGKNPKATEEPDLKDRS
jgi:hypothetical protein